LTDLTANDEIETAPSARPEPWLVGAFLVLFGMAVSAAMPQISLAVQAAVTNAGKAQSPARETAQKQSSRVAVAFVRTADPVFGGADALPPHVVWATDLHHAAVHPRAIDLSALIEERIVRARAPPSRNA
jgi:hypothetical protein